MFGKKYHWCLNLLLAGARCQQVNYGNTVCAVKGSTVTLPCTFTHTLTVVRVVWCVNHLICQGTTPSVYDSNSSKPSRYQYLGDKDNNCTLQIENVQAEDATVFRFRMESETNKGHFTGIDGIKVEVNDGTKMKIRRSKNSDDTITLTCISDCNINKLSVTWYKDGRILSESSPTLHLGLQKPEVSGNYSCALTTNLNTISQLYRLYVEERDDKKKQNVLHPLAIGIIFGILLLLSLLVMLLFIIKRKRRAASGKHHKSADDTMDQVKYHEHLYSEIQEPVGMERRNYVEEESYVSVQFKYQNPTRQAVQREESTIYSLVAGHS